jgi:cation transport protein ChaC
MTTLPRTRTMRLGERHVEALRREIPDPGFRLFPGMRPATEADYEAIVADWTKNAPADGFWVFAIGSLIWNPAYDFVEERVARARGWHRAFCLGWDYRFRGNADQPGLMMALDRGGECTGVAYRLKPETLKESLDMSMVPSAFPSRWIMVTTEAGPLRALTFAMDRKSGRYVSGLDENALADVLATACGFRGSMCEYLYSTVRQLESLGIHDRHLWRLQEMVAERVEQRLGM